MSPRYRVAFHNTSSSVRSKQTTAACGLYYQSLLWAIFYLLRSKYIYVSTCAVVPRGHGRPAAQLSGFREAEAVRGSTSPDTPTAEPSPQEHPRAAAGRHRQRGRDGGIGGMNQELDPFPTHLCQRTLAPMQDPKIRSYKHAPRK